MIAPDWRTPPDNGKLVHFIHVSSQHLKLPILWRRFARSSAFRTLSLVDIVAGSSASLANVE